MQRSMLRRSYLLVFVGLAMPACGDDEAASHGTSSESTGDMPTGGVAESSTGAGESGEEETEKPAQPQQPS
jgi:hypothetical protein